MTNRSFSLAPMSQSLRRVALLFGLAAVYYFAAKLGLRFAYINSSVTTIWPPTGIALAAFVLLGYRVWPAILGAAFLANFATTGAVLPSIGIAIGNTAEGLLGAYLVNRFARGGRVFNRVRDILRFTLLAALVSTVVSATIGILSLLLGGLVSWSDVPRVWLTWWLGQAGGDIARLPGLVAAPSVVLAAVVAAQRARPGAWRAPAVTAPLAGLANPRQLGQALGGEIKRSRRTAQPLAVVLLDLDGLKQINDRHGHLAGSLAIRRVAEALLGSCRATDTAARFGGDEFALVLPETGEAAAWHVARGVVDRLATDAEKPNLSISVGVAVYPGHGETVEALLNAADVALYETKERRKSRASGLAP